jgi:hypothetical protein
MYRVKTFFTADEYETVQEYAKWLSEIQKEETIEIESVVNYEEILVVTYKVKGESQL